MFVSSIDRPRQDHLSLVDKIIFMNWGLVLIILLIGGVGLLALYSAANGSMEPYAIRHVMRFSVGFIVMLFVALIDIRFWRNMAWPMYIVTFLLLIAVEVMGFVGMGAQRWINLGFMNLQPSEVMKMALVLILARYLARYDPSNITTLRTLWPVVLMIAIPTGMVAVQPDLGTSILIVAAGVAMLWLAGLKLWVFLSGALMAAIVCPIAWLFFLKDYQKRRVLTFLNPESDPLGAGYHVTQSKIALGSGGFDGKGFLEGSQSHLNFLPEKQTDFIFTLWAEEWGFIGGLFVLFLFLCLFGYGFLIGLRCRNQFARLLTLGLTMNIMFYVMINVGMVMGLLPIVGVPLPMVSYGGTALMVTMFSIGLILSASIHRDVKMTQLF